MFSEFLPKCHIFFRKTETFSKIFLNFSEIFGQKTGLKQVRQNIFQWVSQQLMVTETCFNFLNTFPAHIMNFCFRKCKRSVSKMYNLRDFRMLAGLQCYQRIIRKESAIVRREPDLVWQMEKYSVKDIAYQTTMSNC